MAASAACAFKEFSPRRNSSLRRAKVPVVQLRAVNELDQASATVELQRCCGSPEWARQMVARRPFPDADSMLQAAEEIWWKLPESEWILAFSHHPKIGANVEELRKKFAATADWSKGEQSGMGAASEKTIEELARGNSDYATKF